MSAMQTRNERTAGKGTYRRLAHGETVWDLLSRRKLWYRLSILILAVSLLGVVVRGMNFSIEFEGGAEFSVPQSVSQENIDAARTVVEDVGLPDMNDITVTGIGENTITVTTRSLETSEVVEVRAALGDWANVTAEDVSYRLIGASWGDQITNRAITALVVFMVLVSVMIAIYFRDWKMSVAAIIAVIHDLIVTIGVYAWVGFSITPSTLTAILTILGYSLYDTMVVFDKVRENVAGMRTTRETYTGATNRAVNEVLVRSINTTIIGVLPIVALLFAGVFLLGSGPIKDMSLAMFVGMLAGAYSSIFIATSLLVDMKEREPDMVSWRQRLARLGPAPATVEETPAPRDRVREEMPVPVGLDMREEDPQFVDEYEVDPYGDDRAAPYPGDEYDPYRDPGTDPYRLDPGGPLRDAPRPERHQPRRASRAERRSAPREES